MCHRPLIEEKYLFCKTPKIKGLLSMKLGNYYANYSRQEVERTRTSEMTVMFMFYFTWSYCKQLASNVKLATGKYKIISRQLGSFEVLFSRPTEVSVVMGEWATVNFCPWQWWPSWNSDQYKLCRGIYKEYSSQICIQMFQR